jgi:hypothetical protein
MVQVSRAWRLVVAALVTQGVQCRSLTEKSGVARMALAQHTVRVARATCTPLTITDADARAGIRSVTVPSGRQIKTRSRSDAAMPSVAKRRWNCSAHQYARGPSHRRFWMQACPMTTSPNVRQRSHSVIAACSTASNVSLRVAHPKSTTSPARKAATTGREGAGSCRRRDRRQYSPDSGATTATPSNDSRASPAASRRDPTDVEGSPSSRPTSWSCSTHPRLFRFKAIPFAASRNPSSRSMPDAGRRGNRIVAPCRRA